MSATTCMHRPDVAHEALPTNGTSAIDSRYLWLCWRSGLPHTRCSAPSASQQHCDPTCPVRNSVGNLGRRSFVWYLHEVDPTLAGIAPVTVGFDFCQWHAQRLMANEGASPQIAFVHQFVARQLRLALRKSTTNSPFSGSAVCFACQPCDESLRSAAHFVNGALYRARR